MKWLKSKFRQEVDKERNTSVKEHLKDRIAHINRKMSRGASNIYKTIKTHTKWGNKQLWGFKEKNGRKSDHYVPQKRSIKSKMSSFFRHKTKKKGSI